MNLSVLPPLAPMEAKAVSRIPTGDHWLYEPKWDGFRCIVFRDGREVMLQSKAEKPLGRYFPELVRYVGALEARRFVLDAEIVVPVEGAFSFDDLLQRIHPAASRINRLAREHPALLIVFDLLLDEHNVSLLNEPFRFRRRRLEAFSVERLKDAPGFKLSAATAHVAEAQKWLDSGGLDLDGVIAKRMDMPYRPGERTGMQKIKRKRTADCVVGGFRYSASSYSDGRLAESQREVGSLLLGLYDNQGLLHHVGFCSGLNKKERRLLVRKLEPIVERPGFTGSTPGGPSRWSTERSDRWQPLAPKLVVEVEWDHFTGGRFRHGTRLLRWRPDKRPDQCTMDQIRKTTAPKSLT